METEVLRNRVNIPVFVAYRLHMEFNGDASRFERAMQEVINYGAYGINPPPDTEMSPPLWEWIKTEIDKYN